MKWKKPICVLLVVTLILSMGIASVGVNANPLPKLFVDPPTYYATLLGETFTININIFNITNLGCFEFKLGYNTTLLDALNAAVGPFPPNPESIIEIHDPEGYVRISVICSTTQGSGTLATITFSATCAESGSCPLDLYGTVIGDWAGDPVAHEIEDGNYEFVTQPITVATDKPTYLPGENIEIHGNLTLPPEGLVALQVDDPNNRGIVMRTVQTIAMPPPGDIEIIDLYPCDTWGIRKDSFERGRHAYFNATARNSGTEWKTVTIIVNAYDGNMVPLPLAQSLKVLIGPNYTAGFVTPGIFLPTWAYVGAGMVYACALTDWPKDGGVPYCPEKSATFSITGGGGGGGAGAPPQGSGNYSLTFKLPPDAANGIYRVYASFNYPTHHITSGTAFGIRAICVPNHYPTIQSAVNAASPTNNTIIVCSRTYNENVAIIKNLTLVGTGPSKTVINGGGTGTVINIAAGNVEISGFKIQNSGSSSQDSGISLQNSSGCTIQNNIITSNWYGINVHSSNSNSILDNTLSKNNYGIYLNRSTSNTLRKNNMICNKYNFGVLGNSISDFNHDIDTSNTVERKPLYYWKNQADKQVPADAGFVAAVNSNRITVKALNLTKNVQGVLFAFTSDSVIERVNTKYNEYGIYLVQSSGNTIISGTTSNNMVGIYLTNSNENIICHKNFINNTNQVQLYQSSNTWDDSAGKGNHWSDYTGADNGTGGRIAGDGVGDTLLPHLSVDWYPLMKPRTPVHNIAITSVTHLLPRSDVTHVYPGWDITIIATIKNEGDFTETSLRITAYYFNATATYLIGTKTVSELAPLRETAISFTWDTTGVSPGNYTMKATAGAVQLIDGTVKVRPLGDVDDNGKVNILDLKKVKLAYSLLIDEPMADIDGDGDIDILDLKKVKLAYSGLI